MGPDDIESIDTREQYFRQGEKDAHSIDSKRAAEATRGSIDGKIKLGSDTITQAPIVKEIPIGYKQYGSSNIYYRITDTPGETTVIEASSAGSKSNKIHRNVRITRPTTPTQEKNYEKGLIDQLIAGKTNVQQLIGQKKLDPQRAQEFLKYQTGSQNADILMPQQTIDVVKLEEQVETPGDALLALLRRSIATANGRAYDSRGHAQFDFAIIRNQSEAITSGTTEELRKAGFTEGMFFSPTSDAVFDKEPGEPGRPIYFLSRDTQDEDGRPMLERLNAGFSYDRDYLAQKSTPLFDENGKFVGTQETLKEILGNYHEHLATPDAIKNIVMQ